MLSRQFRLNEKKDFDRVWKKGRAFFIPAMGVKVAASALPYTRFGFVVALTVSKSAVKRNTIKRRWRGYLGQHKVLIRPGLDVVVLARLPICTLTRKQSEEQFTQLLRRAGVLQFTQS